MKKDIGLLLLLVFHVMSGTAFASDLGLLEADCRCCHGSTLADRHHLLIANTSLECLSCHEMSFDPVTVTYDPVVVRDCLQCHTGSLADRHHVLVDQANYNCSSCHAMIFNSETMTYSPDFNVSCEKPLPEEIPGSIDGIVADLNGVVLSWARVATDNGVYAALTTEAGTYQVADIAPGDYLLEATLDGFVGVSQQVSVVSGQSTRVDFILAPLLNPGTVSGVIQDQNSVPVQGVTIDSEPGVYSALSGVDGSYTLMNVGQGSYLISAKKTGYITASQVINVGAGQLVTADFILTAIPVEICGDGIDNDNNGLTDCTDPACADTAGCLAGPVEICNDAIDNDLNGLTDCSDSVCIGTEECPVPVEACGDGFDNDDNGLADCADPACAATTDCLPDPVEICGDGVDNDTNSLTDCEDPMCANTSNCLPPPVEICNDGLDNDDNGLIDCLDTKCSEDFYCLSPPVEICNDGLDNDGNGLFDCADQACIENSACEVRVYCPFLKYRDCRHTEGCRWDRYRDTCKADTTNQDCNGDWGGSAFYDSCNNCVRGKTGLTACVQDCAGVWGGKAVVDDCGVCDANPANDCIAPPADSRCEDNYWQRRQRRQR